MSCSVVPSDSYGDGITKSGSALVENTPPTALDLNIYPLRVGDQRLQSQDLDAVYTYVDLDGDLESGSQIRWYKDGELQSDYNNLLQVSSSDTATGQVWYFTVTPSDGEDFGDVNASDPITIYTNIAPVTGTPTLVSRLGTNQADEDLIATAVGHR